MAKSVRFWATILGLLCYFGTISSAQTPVDFLEVVTVTPSRVIKHEVDLKGPFDDRAIETNLIGPAYFSGGVGFDQTEAEEPQARLNWYRIAKPTKEPRRTISVSVSLRGDETQQITVGNAAFLLSPAQSLTTGTPSQIPDGLNYFKAYRIIGGTPINQSVKLTGTMGPEQRTASTPIFFCIPAEEWHHDEHFPIRNSEDCLIVYELDPHKLAVTLNTIDQFGLNKLEAESSNWLCVRAKIASAVPSQDKKDRE